MTAAGTIEGMGSYPSSGSSAQPQGWGSAAAQGTAAVGNTLHCSPKITDSAAQFNRSISAMPCCTSHRIDACQQGMADILS